MYEIHCISLKWMICCYKFTCTFCRLAEASLISWGTSKHLAVVTFALTSHCWKSLKLVRNLCCKICSLLWHPFEACRQRLDLSHQGSRREQGREERQDSVRWQCFCLVLWREVRLTWTPPTNYKHLTEASGNPLEVSNSLKVKHVNWVSQIWQISTSRVIQYEQFLQAFSYLGTGHGNTAITIWTSMT